MWSELDHQLKEIIETEIQSYFQENCDSSRKRAKEQIAKIQDENLQMYNLRRRAAIQYKENDLVAIKRTLFGSGRKLKGKFCGPYVIYNAKGNDTYDVKSIGFHDGPRSKNSCAEYIKPYKCKDPLSKVDD